MRSYRGGHQLSEAGGGLLDPLQGVDELLQVCFICRGLHGNQTIHSTCVEADAVRGNEGGHNSGPPW